VPEPIDLDVEWLVDNFLIVGSPETVAGKIRALYGEAGGFGTIITTNHDYTDNPEAQRRHLELLGTRVAPLLSDLTGA
jgi:alkanesulfonate monooxygenase SsuD/methylene tetrahydromethanopterin reductase-like flavin-dependent oxidoreductase (luciferase family)